jgi:hypothetical protein
MDQGRIVQNGTRADPGIGQRDLVLIRERLPYVQAQIATTVTRAAGQ